MSRKPRRKTPLKDSIECRCPFCDQVHTLDVDNEEYKLLYAAVIRYVDKHTRDFEEMHNVKISQEEREAVYQDYLSPMVAHCPICVKVVDKPYLRLVQ